MNRKYEEEKIGKVSFFKPKKKREGSDYTDSSEKELLRIFSNKDSNLALKKTLKKRLSWSLRYHLSPTRENLLNWYTFPKGSSLLEVGAGCGALTGLFCNNLEKVVALELSEQRARINALRYKNNINLEVVSENIQNFSYKEKFDYVICVGVLEYAGLYIDEKNPHLALLKVLKNHLKPEGKLILAIENKLGIKYWSGCTEDHTGRGFDSILSYPFSDSVKTFGKVELEDLLVKVGFNRLEWHYPLPDYKMPAEVFSDKFLPGENKFFSTGIFPSKDYLHNRVYLFSEILAMNSLIKNKLFQNFANSFLIFAS